MSQRKNVAIISPTHSEVYREVLTGLGKSDYARNWDTFIDENCRGAADPEWLFETDWDGIIYDHRDRQLPKMARDRGIPCVDINDESNPIDGVPKIRPDNNQAGRMAADYFKSLGFHSFAFCGWENLIWSIERKTGYLQRLRELDCKFTSFETHHPNGMDQPITVIGPEWDQVEIDSIIHWLETLEVPTAILACDDARAAQISKATQACGLKSPSEISILGNNNETFRCEFSKPTLSTIDLNGSYRGNYAAQILDEMMSQENHYISLNERIQPLEIVSRQSTDACAINDKIVAKALSIIQKEACKGLRVTDLVKRVHTSRRLLERKFQKYLGVSPNKAIRDSQVAQIKGLINHTNMSITEIAYAAGFAHPEYMNVVFKRVAGMTPGDYRNKISGTA